MFKWWSCHIFGAWTLPREKTVFSVSESRQEGQRELDTVAVQAAAEEEDWAAKGPAFLETPW
jgi:hypothetical protein